MHQICMLHFKILPGTMPPELPYCGAATVHLPDPHPFGSSALRSCRASPANVPSMCVVRRRHWSYTIRDGTNYIHFTLCTCRNDRRHSGKLSPRQVDRQGRRHSFESGVIIAICEIWIIRKLCPHCPLCL